AIEGVGARRLVDDQRARVAVRVGALPVGGEDVVLGSGAHQRGPLAIAVEVDLDLAFAPPAVVERMAEDADVSAEVAALAGDVRQDLEVLAELGPALAAP